MSDTEKKQPDAEAAIEAATFSVFIRFLELADARLRLYELAALGFQMALAKQPHEIVPDFQQTQQLTNSFDRTTLISAISIVDTFVTDVTRILLLRTPNLCADKQIRLGEVLSYSTYSEVVEALVNKTLADLGFRNLKDRFDFLCKNFSLDLSRCAPELDRLVDFAELRNEVVHDVSHFRYLPSEIKGSVTFIPKGRTANVSEEILRSLTNVCLSVAGELYFQVVARVFHNKPAFLVDFVAECRRLVRPEAAPEAGTT